MKEIYFVCNGEKYIIDYKDGTMNIYKYTDGIIEPLSLKEKEELFNKEYSYTYNSSTLHAILSDNTNIPKNQYMMSLLEWLENGIPEECQANLYRNVATLKVNLNLDVDFSNMNFISKDDKDFPNSTSNDKMQTGGYNAMFNKITIDEEAMKQCWNIAKNTQNPQEFFWREYSLCLLHELTHMASTRYNLDAMVVKSGFDVYPSSNFEEQNRGLTEGMTEVIAMSGVPGTIELASGYYIEASIVNQLSYLIGSETLVKSYFSNLGINPLKEKLNEIIGDPDKSTSLFRFIELNYVIRNSATEQNLLGDIQSSLLDYLDKKVELLISSGKQDEVSTLLTNFKSMMVNKQKLELMKKNPNNYEGIEDNFKKYEEISNKYKNYITEEKEIEGNVR